MNHHVSRRDLLKVTTAGVLAAGMSASARFISAHEPSTDQTLEKDLPWYRRNLVGIEWGPTGANDKDSIYLSKATGKQIIGHLVKAHAQYAVVFMKDMEFAYYDSRVARKCPNLGKRDLLEECLEEASRHDMPVIAYCQVQYDHTSWHAHPEWRMKDAGGKEITNRLCYNSGYLGFIQAVVAEMLQYDIHGFHIDMLDYGFGPPYGCWCEHCQKRFQESYGMPLPAGVTWDDTWEKMLDFRCESNTRFCREVERFIKQRRPELSVDFNYHGYPPFSWETGERPVKHAMNGDFVTAEGLPFIFGHDNPSFLALFMAGARPAGPIQCVTSRTVHGYHDFNVRPAAEIKWEVLTYLSHGAQCTIVDKANYDGGLDHVAYERIGQAFDEATKKQPYFGHPPIPEVGLYFSSRTRDWYGKESPTKYMASFWGAHKALKETHVPMSMIMDENVTPRQLRALPVVYVPHAAVLTENEVQLFTEYVSEGGNLLITGLTGIADLHGRLQKTSRLSELLGARLVRCQTDHFDNYVRLPGNLAGKKEAVFSDDVPSDWPLLTWGPLAVYEPDGADAFGQVMTAYRSKSNQWMNHMSPDKAVGPAVLVHHVGQGTVVAAAGSPDAAFVGDFRMVEHRNLIRNLIRYLNPQPRVRVEAPSHVEIILTEDKRRPQWYLHFLCFSPSIPSVAVPFPQGTRVLPPLMEEALPYLAKVHVAQPFAQVHAVGDETRFLSKTRQTVQAHIQGPHEVLVFEK